MREGQEGFSRHACIPLNVNEIYPCALCMSQSHIFAAFFSPPCLQVSSHAVCNRHDAHGLHVGNLAPKASQAKIQTCITAIGARSQQSDVTGTEFRNYKTVLWVTTAERKSRGASVHKPPTAAVFVVRF